MFLTAPLAADTVRLTNGDVLTGEILRQDDEHVVLRTEFGELTLKKRDVARVSYEPRGKDRLVNVYTTKGRAYRGRLVDQDDTRLIVETASGRHEIAKRDVARVDWRERIVDPAEEYADRRLPALWRSLVLPGWGQIWQGKETKGWLIAGGIALLGGAALYAGLRFGTLRDRYNALYYDDVALRASADRWRTAYNILGWTFVVGWLLNAADATVFAPRSSMPNYQRVTFKPVISPAGLAAGVSVTF